MRDPRHGHLYDLKPLALNDTVVNAGEYTYYLRVCGQLSSSVCAAADRSKAVSACQEKRGPLGFQRVAGTAGFSCSRWESVGSGSQSERTEGVFLQQEVAAAFSSLAAGAQPGRLPPDAVRLCFTLTERCRLRVPRF